MDSNATPTTPPDSPQDTPDNGDKTQAARRLFDTAAPTKRTPTIRIPPTKKANYPASDPPAAKNASQDAPKTSAETQMSDLHDQVTALTQQMSYLMGVIAQQQKDATAAPEPPSSANATSTAAPEPPSSAKATTRDVTNQEGDATHLSHPSTQLSRAAAIHSPSSVMLSQHIFRKTDLQMYGDSQDLKPKPTNPSIALSAFRRIKPEIASAIKDIKQPGIQADITLNTFISEIRAVLTSPADHTVAAILTEALTTGSDSKTNSTTQNLLRLAVKSGSSEEIHLQAQQIRQTGRYNRSLAALADVTQDPNYNKFNPETDQGKNLWAAILDLLLSYWQRPKSARADQKALETKYLSMSCTNPTEISAHITNEAELYTKLESAHVIYSDQQRIRSLLASCSENIRVDYLKFKKRQKEDNKWNHFRDTDVHLFAQDPETVTDAMDSDEEQQQQTNHTPRKPHQPENETSTHRQKTENDNRPCWDHQYMPEGCHRGEHCPWQHEGEAAAKKLRYATEDGKCRAFLTGACDRGDQCKFSHSESPAKPSDAPRKKTECRQYKDGHCPRGDKCTMLHVKNDESLQAHHAKPESDSDSDLSEDSDEIFMP